MSRVVAVVEGQTEQDFIQQVLSPWLATRGVYMTARLVGDPDHKGGVGEYQRARRDVLLLLKQDKGATVTTMFDFYGMPDSWPGRKAARSMSFREKALTVEQAIKRDVVSQLGGSFDESRFVPYVQMHEFEALLFAEPRTICEVLRCPQKTADAQRVRDDVSTPEEINDSERFAPSKRLKSLHEFYRKRLHGSIIAERIGIDVICHECPHFAEWVSTLLSRGS